MMKNDTGMAKWRRYSFHLTFPLQLIIKSGNAKNSPQEIMWMKRLRDNALFGLDVCVFFIMKEFVIRSEVLR